MMAVEGLSVTVEIRQRWFAWPLKWALYGVHLVFGTDPERLAAFWADHAFRVRFR